MGAGCDLSGLPSKGMLRLLAGHCSEGSEQDHLLLLASKDGRDAYKTEVHPRNPEVPDANMQTVAVLLDKDIVSVISVSVISATSSDLTSAEGSRRR